MKRQLSITRKLTIVLLSSAMLMSSFACNRAVKIDASAYPDAQNSQETNQTNEDPTNEGTTEDGTPFVLSKEDFEKYFGEPVDSIKETGEFVYNPYYMNPDMKNKYKENPKVVVAAYTILEALYNYESEVELGSEFDLNDEELDDVYMLLYSAGAINQVVDVESDDHRLFTIKYFPKLKVTSKNDYDFQIEAVDGEDPVEAERRISVYLDYVNKTIKENITPEMTDIERAEVIYNKIIEDFDLQVRDQDSYMSYGAIEYDDDGVGYLESFSLIDDMEDGTLSIDNFPSLYSYILDQLNVDYQYVGCGGTIKDTGYEYFDSYLYTEEWISWTIIKNEDNKYYNCVLLFDELVEESYKADGRSYGQDLEYFGISDDTLRKTFGYSNAERYNMSTVSETVLPDCEEDLKKN